MDTGNTGKRRTGRAYRRKTKRRHQKNRMQIILRRGFRPNIGSIDCVWVNGVRQLVGNHIKYPRNSKAQHYWKRHSNKIIRRRGEVCRAGQYRKCFDYWWTLY